MTGIFQWYVETVGKYPFQAAFVQFAVLGMVGDLIASAIIGKKPEYGFFGFLKKMLGWGILGIIIKTGFAGMHGFTEALYAKLHIASSSVLLFAFIKSTVTNTFFGPQMMLFHRWEDNLLQGTKGYKGMDTAIRTLFWFWIPAHTVTFVIANHDVQIGLAAAWSLVLGLILGLAKRKTV
ncbi:hypothetical protein CSA37_08340 [Candidatus Fermentibacteria bacterium]|nr:MAG: hypothetical protein CSA37_08340 [Candidatus Fermentibacteria bacterium]